MTEMMVTERIEYTLDSGGCVLVAVASTPESGGLTRGWGGDRPLQVVEKANQTFESAVAKLRPAADAVLASLSGLTSTPEEITVEFGVELTAEAGI